MVNHSLGVRLLRMPGLYSHAAGMSAVLASGLRDPVGLVRQCGRSHGANNRGIDTWPDSTSSLQPD